MAYVQSRLKILFRLLLIYYISTYHHNYQLYSLFFLSRFLVFRYTKVKNKIESCRYSEPHSYTRLIVKHDVTTKRMSTITFSLASSHTKYVMDFLIYQLICQLWIMTHQFRNICRICLPFSFNLFNPSLPTFYYYLST